MDSYRTHCNELYARILRLDLDGLLLLLRRCKCFMFGRRRFRFALLRPNFGVLRLESNLFDPLLRLRVSIFLLPLGLGFGR